MKKYILLLAILLGLNAQAFGFATAVTKIKGGDEIVINTNIQQVSIFLDGIKVGESVGNVFVYKVNRTGQPRTFVLKKQGFKDSSVTLTTQFDTFFWGNAVFGLGGSFSSSTDSWSTNSTREYTPNQFYVDMIKE